MSDIYTELMSAQFRGVAPPQNWVRRATDEIDRLRTQLAAQSMPPKERLALNTMHQDCHKAADAFWEYWQANGETHKRGYYESTWGAINRALRTVGVVEHDYPQIQWWQA